MDKPARGRPATATANQKRNATRERQQARRRRITEGGGRSITLAVPGELLSALDAAAKRRGVSRAALLLSCVRAEIIGSEPPPEAAAAEPAPRIVGSEAASSNSAPRILGSGTTAMDSEPNPGNRAPGLQGPRYRGRALLLAAAVGAVLGSWLTLALN